MLANLVKWLYFIYRLLSARFSIPCGPLRCFLALGLAFAFGCDASSSAFVSFTLGRFICEWGGDVEQRWGTVPGLISDHSKVLCLELGRGYTHTFRMRRLKRQVIIASTHFHLRVEEAIGRCAVSWKVTWHHFWIGRPMVSYRLFNFNILRSLVIYWNYIIVGEICAFLLVIQLMLLATMNPLSLFGLLLEIASRRLLSLPRLRLEPF